MTVDRELLVLGCSHLAAPRQSRGLMPPPRFFANNSRVFQQIRPNIGYPTFDQSDTIPVLFLVIPKHVTCDVILKVMSS